jgi:predicted RNase H-like HicB family nuclease
MEFPVIIEYDPENGSYGASSPDVAVDGIGKTAEEAVARFKNALESHMRFLREHGLELPPPRHTVTTVNI